MKIYLKKIYLAEIRVLKYIKIRKELEEFLKRFGIKLCKALY